MIIHLQINVFFPSLYRTYCFLGHNTISLYTRAQNVYLKYLNKISYKFIFNSFQDIKWYNVKHKGSHEFGTITDFSVLEIQFYYMFLLSSFGMFYETLCIIIKRNNHRKIRSSKYMCYYTLYIVQSLNVFDKRSSHSKQRNYIYCSFLNNYLKFIDYLHCSSFLHLYQDFFDILETIVFLSAVLVALKCYAYWSIFTGVDSLIIPR